MTDRDRLPLPSEDEGDLTDAPTTGASDDPMVATEEGVPYTPPSDRVLAPRRAGEDGSDVAGTPPDDAGELAADDTISAPSGDLGARGERGELPQGDALLADVLAELRDSDVLAGDRIEVAVSGRTVTLRGEVESIEVGDEIAGIAGDVPGVDEVVDETRIAGM